MLFRQLFDAGSSTFTYLVADEATLDAVLIDCVFEQHLRDKALLRELGLNLRWTLETHVHADHVTGAWLMKESLGSRIAVARAANVQGADILLGHNDVLSIGELSFVAQATPGHTDGCLTYVCPSLRCAFTGDALLIRGAGRTDFQGGSAERLFHSVREKIFSLADDYLLYPAHDYSGRTVTTVCEEKEHNPRLALHVREEDFVGYMQNLNLPHPKKIATAVPANLMCGRPAERIHNQRQEKWGPVVRTYAGVWQVEPEWAYAHRDALRFIDVRQALEFKNDLIGTIDCSLNIPLDELRASFDMIPADLPIVTLCPAGARSAIAAQVLDESGKYQVANLRGGIFAWRDLGFPLETEV